MTLEDLIERYRPHLMDETVGVRRSWEDTFRLTLRCYPKETPLTEFDLAVLKDRMMATGIHALFVDGYIKRWRGLLDEPEKR
jgi:hypothetical protein